MERIEDNHKKIDKETINQKEIYEKNNENKKSQKQLSNIKILLKKIFIYLFSNIINIFILFLFTIVEIYQLNGKYKINFRLIFLLLFIINFIINGILDIKNYFNKKRINKTNINEKLKNEMLEKEKKQILTEQFSTIDSENKILEKQNNLTLKNARVEINEKNMCQSPEKKSENFETINSSNFDSEREENSLRLTQNFEKQLSDILEDYDDKIMNDDYTLKLKRYCFVKIMSHVGYHIFKQILSKRFNKWKKKVGIKK